MMGAGKSTLGPELAVRLALPYVDTDAEVESGAGCAIAQPGVREPLEASGAVVYLHARAETPLSRLGDCLDRPLLRDLAPAQREARRVARLDARWAAYESPGIAVDTDTGAVEESVDRVARRLRNGAAS